MNQILSFIPSAKTLWLLVGGGFVSTIIAVLIPAPLGIYLAILLTLGWYFIILILAVIDAMRGKSDRVQVSRAQLGKLSIDIFKSKLEISYDPSIADKSSGYYFIVGGFHVSPFLLTI